MIKKRMSKKAVSLMVSYILLISIALVVSVGVYAWLRAVANVEPPITCKDETTVIIESYDCTSGDEGGIDLIIKNNGRFNVKGIILTVGNDSVKTPTTSLLNIDPKIKKLEGHHFFVVEDVNGIEVPELAPGESTTASFTNKIKDEKIVDFEYVRTVKLQPFVSDEEDNKILCPDAVIRQDLKKCKIKGDPIVKLVTATASYQDNYPEKAIDGSPLTEWNSGSNNSANLTIEYSSDISISSYSLECGGDGYTNGEQVKIYFYDSVGTKKISTFTCGDHKAGETISRDFTATAKTIIISLKKGTLDSEDMHIKEFKINNEFLV